MSLSRPASWWPLAALLGVAAGAGHARADEPILVEFHFTPVPEAQIAIWLEDKDGKHVRDVMVTQATGKYGIGNRPGQWNFLSSWRMPYGPRPSVLPVWAHRRGKTYPKIIFHDEDPSDLNSVGFHENTSSDEHYFCRPLLPAEHATISVDTKTCPSPQTFNSDKGQFDPQGGISMYPPRNDLLAFDAFTDAPETKMYAALNDLDAVTAATPPGDAPFFVTALVPPEVYASAPLTAYIEISREFDENQFYDYDRKVDYFPDSQPSLMAYGVEYLGQPSVVYRVEFDPRVAGFRGTVDYAGYGDWNGATGTLHPPDGTISTTNGSGADRLRVTHKNGETFRWGVYAHGPGGGGGGTGGETDSGGSGGGGTGGTGGGGGGTGEGDSETGGGGTGGGEPMGSGWGGCSIGRLAPIDDLTLTPIAFDRVRVDFRLPEQTSEFDLKAVHVYHITGESMVLGEELLGAAHINSFQASDLQAGGGLVGVEIGELWGDYTYQFGVVYEDTCTNRSDLVTAMITTPAQKFQTVDSFCFVATAAYGAPWAAQVTALRAFRDAYLKTSPTGLDLVRFYYAHSPPLARVIEHEPLLRGLARVVLQPVADAAQLLRGPSGPEPPAAGG